MSDPNPVARALAEFAVDPAGVAFIAATLTAIGEEDLFLAAHALATRLLVVERPEDAPARTALLTALLRNGLADWLVAHGRRDQLAAGVVDPGLLSAWLDHVQDAGSR